PGGQPGGADGRGSAYGGEGVREGCGAVDGGEGDGGGTERGAGEPRERGGDPGGSAEQEEDLDERVQRGRGPRDRGPGAEEPRHHAEGKEDHRLPRGGARAGGAPAAERGPAVQDQHRLARHGGRVHALPPGGGPAPDGALAVQGHAG